MVFRRQTTAQVFTLLLVGAFWQSELRVVPLVQAFSPCSYRIIGSSRSSISISISSSSSSRSSSSSSSYTAKTSNALVARTTISSFLNLVDQDMEDDYSGVPVHAPPVPQSLSQSSEIVDHVATTSTVSSSWVSGGILAALMIGMVLGGGDAALAEPSTTEWIAPSPPVTLPSPLTLTLPSAAAATSSLSSSSHNFVGELGDAFGFVGSVVRSIFQLLYQVLVVILPIVGKAFVAAGRAASPAISEGAQAAGEYLKVAAQEGGAAAKPFVQEASMAAQPYLDQVGATVNDAATMAGTAVTVKAVQTSNFVQSGVVDQAKVILKR